MDWTRAWKLEVLFSCSATAIPAESPAHELKMCYMESSSGRVRNDKWWFATNFGKDKQSLADNEVQKW